MAASDYLGRQFQLHIRGRSKTDGSPVDRWVSGKVIDETDTHVTLEAPWGQARIHKGNIVEKRDTTPAKRNVRSAEDREAARTDLLGKIGTDWSRVPEGANASDVDHLVKMGHIESRVTHRWDSVVNRSGYFGGYNTVKRKYKEVRRIV